MPREIQDSQNTIWNCLQAYAGLNQNSENQAAAKTGNGLVTVICTPNGGAQTVRLELATDWETALSDDELADAIKNQQSVD